MSTEQNQAPEDLMVEQGVWPRTGGWWQCVDHGFFSSTDLVEWRHPESGAASWQCPECGRRDLVQWEQALIAVPAAHHEHALKVREQQVLRDVVKTLQEKQARHEEKVSQNDFDAAWNQGAAAACRDLADALLRRPESGDLHGIERQPFPSFDESCTYLERVTVPTREFAEALIRREYGYEDEALNLQPVYMRWVEKKPDGTLLFEGPGWYECDVDEPGSLPFWKDPS